MSTNLPARNIPPAQLMANLRKHKLLVQERQQATTRPQEAR